MSTPPQGRVELHIHLDGSVTPQTLLEVSRARNLTLPVIGHPHTVDDIMRLMNATVPAWNRFYVVEDIIGADVNAIELAAERFVAFQVSNGVTYTEVRYDPVRLATSPYAKANITASEVVEAVRAGLVKGMNEHRSIEVYQLLCAIRGKSAAACMEVAELSHQKLVEGNYAPGTVVGMDLAGNEMAYNNTDYISCFQHAKQLGLNTTIHSGEFSVLEIDDVRVAVEDMKVDRIGHAYAAAIDNDLMATIARQNIHIEACPLSASHHGNVPKIGIMHRAGLNIGLNTDDPSPFFGNGNLSTCEDIVRNQLNWTSEDIQVAYASARSAAFVQTDTFVAIS